jgi:hypothetical protein
MNQYVIFNIRHLLGENHETHIIGDCHPGDDDI